MYLVLVPHDGIIDILEAIRRQFPLKDKRTIRLVQQFGNRILDALLNLILIIAFVIAVCFRRPVIIERTKIPVRAGNLSLRLLISANGK